MRVLVTGALGFIGHHLCLHLADRGFEVYGVDNMFRGDEGRVRLLREQGVYTTAIDVRNLEALTSYMLRVKPDAVVHLAALISTDESFEKPLLYEDVNIRGTISVVLASNRAGVQRLVYVSSAAVYGEPRYLPIDEEHPTNPISPYGATKLAGEHLSRTLFEGERHVVILRPFNVYGPGQSREYAGVVAKFLERLARGEPPVIYGDGRQSRDFVYVADVVEALERALEVEVDGNAVVNVGTGRPVTINELAYRMIRIAGADVKPIYAPPRRGDIRHSYASISRAVSLLRWRPRVSLEEGLEETIKAFFSEQGGAGS